MFSASLSLSKKNLVWPNLVLAKLDLAKLGAQLWPNLDLAKLGLAPDVGAFFYDLNLHHDAE